MKEHKIIWTACPNGVHDGQLRLSVVVSHQLGSSAGDKDNHVLRGFPDALRWPDHDVQFMVAFDAPNSAPVVVAATLRAIAQEPSMWSSLFKGDTLVRGFEVQDYQGHTLRTYSVADTYSYIKSQYGSLGTASPSAPPSSGVLLSDKGIGAVMTTSVAQQHALTRQVTTWRAAPRHGPPLYQRIQRENPRTHPDYYRLHFVEATQFHQPGAVQVTPPAPEPLDFHDMLSALGQYPEVMRRVGLVFDLEVPLATGLPDSGVVSVTPAYTSLGQEGVDAAPNDVLPRTRYLLDSGQGTFLAAPRATGSDLAAGWLALGDAAKFQAFELDLDGAVFKTFDFAATVGRGRRLFPPPNPSAGGKGNGHRPPRVGDTGDTGDAGTGDTTTDSGALDAAALPALRSVGITVARLGRVEQLQSRLAAVAGLTGQEAPTLDADDITRGYRVDVYQGSRKRWYSLLQRDGTYAFTGDGETHRFSDEGWVSLGGTQSPDPDIPGKMALKIHEALFRWPGWSLAAPRPDTPVPGKAPEMADEHDLGLRASFTVRKGSLPRLRFGDGYKLRARAVDLAGNSLPFDERDSGVGGTEIELGGGYSRFEPVPSPVLVERTRTDVGGSTLGESPARLVIRGNYDVRADHYTLLGDATGPHAASERHLLPPRVAESLAEAHGEFDGASGLRKAAYQQIKAHEGDAPAIETGARVALPYLPDPYARGVAVQGLPGQKAGDLCTIPFDGTWPDLTSILLVVEEAEAGKDSSFNCDGATHTLTVSLAKGEQYTLKVSCYLTADDLNHMGVWQWIEEHNKYTPIRLRKLAEDGGHLMITPPREIEVVHAVQQPLLDWAAYDRDHPSDTSLRQLGSYRYFGETVVHSEAAGIPIDGKSTSTFELLSEWDELVDDVNAPEPYTRHVVARAVEKKVDVADTKIDLGYQQELHDTKHRIISYSAIATTRFAEYFPKGTAPLTRTSPPAARNILNSAVPAPPRIRYVIPTFGWSSKRGKRGADDTLTSTRGGNGLRVYMDRPWYTTGEGELLAVLYDSGNVSSFDEVRRGFLTQWGADPAYGGRVSAAAAGDTRGSVYPTVRPEHFRNVAMQKDDVLYAGPDGVSNYGPNVVGFKPEFDHQRRLWFVDIELDIGTAYFPFVRLALARYQPNSLDAPLDKGHIRSCYLSSAVVTDVAQLTAERVATLVFDAMDRKKISVSVGGPGSGTLASATWPEDYDYSASQDNGDGSFPGEIPHPPGKHGAPPPPHKPTPPPQPPHTPARFQVALEKRTAGIEGDLTWLPVVHDVTATYTQYGHKTTVTSKEPLVWDLRPHSLGGGQMMATGDIALPEDPGSGQYRLVITEGEPFYTDNFSPQYPYARRIVYADAIVLE